MLPWIPRLRGGAVGNIVSGFSRISACQVLDLLQQMGSEGLQPNVGFPRVGEGVLALVSCWNPGDLKKKLVFASWNPKLLA